VTNKNRLIKFVRLKNDYIKNFTGIDYANDVDYENIRAWSERYCTGIYNQLSENIQKNNARGLSKYTCIWCIYRLSCLSCDYAQEHGICSDDDTSLYNQYCSHELINSLTNDVYKNMIEQT